MTHLRSHLCTESAEVCVPEVAEGECDILVEKIAKKLAHAIVGPASVH